MLIYNYLRTIWVTLLNSYLIHHTTKLNKWNKHRTSVSKDYSFSGQRIAGFSHIVKLMDRSFGLSKFKWPNARERFKKCNLEDEYLTVFSSASDSIHSGSEDTFNFFFSYLNHDQELRKTIRKTQGMEKKSFSIFLSLCAFKFLTNACIILLDKNKLDKLAIELNYELEKTIEFIKLHNDEVLEHEGFN